MYFMWVDQRRARNGELAWAQRGEDVKDIVTRHAHRAELGDHLADRASDPGRILVQILLCASKWSSPKE